MMRRVVLVAISLVVVASCLGVAKHQQINVGFGWPEAIDGSNPSYITHGFWEFCANMPFPTPQAVKNDPPHPPLGLTLWVDGEPYSGSPLRIFKRPEHLTPPVLNDDVWYFQWTFRFKANYFSNGPHHFYMEWTIGDMIVNQAEHTVLVYDSGKKD